MAKYPSMITTRAGLNLIGDANSNARALIFTRIVAGDGDVPEGTDIMDLTAVVAPKMEIATVSGENLGDGKYKIKGTLDNTTLDTGFRAKEVGVYAKSGNDGTEVLFAYTNGGNYTDYIPDKTTPIDAQDFFINIVIGNAENVEIVISDDNIVTQDDLDAHNESPTAHDDIRQLIAHKGFPIGTIFLYASNGENPQGALLCDGSAVSRTMYPDLFAKIGTTYGAGDGATTFNLPNLSDNRFAEGSTTAGTTKAAGLPNIEGHLQSVLLSPETYPVDGAFTDVGTINGCQQVAGGAWRYTFFDASKSNSIYGNSDTVQPKSLTLRYFIQAFDGQTPDSALIDITQYAQELANKANITGSNMVWHRDVITTSGTYTAPVTGLYKITVKGGGGGGSGGHYDSTLAFGGAGGGEGGTTIAYERMHVGDTATVIIGAGGAGGTSDLGAGGSGGNTSVTVNDNTYSAGGGGGGGAEGGGGTGGTGTINGCSGGTYHRANNASTAGANGGGAGGSAGVGGNNTPSVATNGGGGAGGGGQYGAYFKAGADGGDGYVWFEYFDPSLNP